MDDNEWLADRFEEHRTHLRAVAYRMLGSLTEAEDALQDAWERVSRAGADDVENLGGWLTTIVARVCLNMLRRRDIRREQSLEVHVPDPIISPEGPLQPDDEVLLADSVGLALQVVLDTLGPAERLAFVLHDMFDLPFDEIAPMVGRSPEAARQLASRARRRVRAGESRAPDPDPARQRAVVNAFFSAARRGDFDALVSMLHPDVVLRADFGPARPRASTRGPRRARRRPAGAPRRQPERRAAPGPGERSRGHGHHSARPALRGAGIHCRRWEDRGDRCDRRSRTGCQGGVISAIDQLNGRGRPC